MKKGPTPSADFYLTILTKTYVLGTSTVLFTIVTTLLVLPDNKLFLYLSTIVTINVCSIRGLTLSHGQCFSSASKILCPLVKKCEIYLLLLIMHYRSGLPLRASSNAVSLPIPLLAPVTIAVLPCRDVLL